jgi:hypothetical protein
MVLQAAHAAAIAGPAAQDAVLRIRAAAGPLSALTLLSFPASSLLYCRMVSCRDGLAAIARLPTKMLCYKPLSALM